jgi:hypothetical protein
MPIVSPPIYNPSSISYPVEFITQVVSSNNILYAQAQLFINGLLDTNIEVTPFQVVAGNIYLFKIDFKASAREKTAPITAAKSSVFGDSLNTEYKVFNNDNRADLALLVTYFEEDPVTGLPSNIGIVDTVPFGTYEVLNVTRQRGESLDLNEFTIAPRRVYTNSPTTYNIGREENLFLTVPPLFSNTIRIQTITAAGALIDTAFTDKAFSSNETPFTIGVGVEQLDNTTINAGSLNILNPSIDTYTITAGLRFGTIFLPLTIPKRLKIIDSCSNRSLRVHFLNLLGGADAFTFTSKKTREIESKSKVGNIPVNWDYSATPPTNIYDRGRFKIDVVSKDIYKVESKILSDEELLYISELFSSPETYIEESSALVPCIIKDQNIKVSENNSILIASATIEVAVDRSIQTY